MKLIVKKYVTMSQNPQTQYLCGFPDFFTHFFLKIFASKVSQNAIFSYVF
jgi:hypothetical protein